MKPASICRCGRVRAHLLSYVYFDIVLLSVQFQEIRRIHSGQDPTACQFRNVWLFCTFVCAVAQAPNIQNCTFADVRLIGSVLHRSCREAFSMRMQVTRVARKNCTFVAANSIEPQLSLVSRPGSHINHRQSPSFTQESIGRRFLFSLYIFGIVKGLSSRYLLLEHYLWAIHIPLLYLSKIYITMDLDWHLLRISEEDATSSQPPPPNPIADARPRKKKARTLRETDWGPYKERIIQLHHVEKRPLPEVRILMEQEFGFTAEYVEQPLLPSLHGV